MSLESYLKWHLSQFGRQIRFDHFSTEQVLGGDLVDEVSGQTQLWPLRHGSVIYSLFFGSVVSFVYLAWLLAIVIQ